MKKWRITGYDGINVIFREDIPLYHISEFNIKELLRVLVSKYGLSDREIVNSYLNSRSKNKQDLLELKRLKLKPEFSCGENPFFTVVIVDEK
ncbi:hypothetical protein GNP61_19460 [Aliivibrio fischeri]|uniref:hypothetical protein n=1 Tax=Aliivibrio fischeri TaxID=668 RepID=UPI0012DAF4D2|nr:hypothetical protein [Aliivibrio fischeri]MUK43725.1 hypothetical protein [Aliivibrio fischeri]